MLFIAGSEYVSPGLSLKMERPMWEEGKEDKEEGMAKDDDSWIDMMNYKVIIDNIVL